MKNQNHYKNSLFIFRRDFRLDDNTSLLSALRSSDKVIPCFIFDKKILKIHKKANFRLDFIFDSLLDLNNHLESKNSKLYTFEGGIKEVIEKIHENTGFESIFVNGDYSEYSRKRDETIRKWCRLKDIPLITSHDYLLHIPENIQSNDKKPFQMFSFFYKKAISDSVRKPIQNKFENYFSKEIEGEIHLDEPSVHNRRCIGGRTEGLKILKNITKFNNYDKERNYPNLEGTTFLSPHNKFGTVSIREVFYAIKDSLGLQHPLITELHWRDFFTYIMYFYPFSRKLEFKDRFREIKWSKDVEKFEAWKNGNTGFPIVDAGIRELNETGFMHNRVRMIVASFLTKDLHIDWRNGERYFSEKLIDYDPSVNTGNWQWAASTGCDSVPYFRIFNPWIQQRKFDSECEYIKKWVPELRTFSANEIHDLEKSKKRLGPYPNPIISHSVESKKSKEIFKKII